jgi:protein gp37
MAENSKIEWTDATWNPITGCDIVSPGCINCYAMRLAGTRLRHHPSRAGLTKLVKGKPVWTGEVRLNEKWLGQPLQWQRPRRVFVCAHGDLFHENVPDEWIDKVFAVMGAAQHHTFQVLTKRPDRMRAWAARAMVDHQLCGGGGCNYCGGFEGRVPWKSYPFPNVWLGFSAERQKEFDERWAEMRQVKAAVTFVSMEPLLGPIFFRPAKPDWIIVGGESGPCARDMDAAWARDIRDQCADQGTALFMKQMARKGPIPPDLMVRQFPAAGGTSEDLARFNTALEKS